MNRRAFAFNGFYSFFVLILGLLSCSHKNPKVFEERQLDRSAYFQFYSQQTPELQKSLKNSAYLLFAESREIFFERISQQSARQAFYFGFVPVVVHGDFHPTQVLRNNQQSSIAFFDASDFGPWWIDLVRMEAGAAILARSQSLKLYKAGHCLTAYADTIRGIATNTPARGAELNREALSKKSTTSLGDLFLALDNAKPNFPAHLREDLEKALSPLKIKSLQSRANFLRGAATEAKRPSYWAELSDASWVEIFTELPNPLKALSAANRNGQMKACPRMALAAQLFSPSPTPVSSTMSAQATAPMSAPVSASATASVSASGSAPGLAPMSAPLCIESDGQSYSLWPLKNRSELLNPDDFNSEYALEKHIEWMCMQVARMHAQQWVPSDLKTLEIFLDKNKTFSARLKDLALSEAETVLTGHRMIWDESGRTP